jgi:hypothetical protein
VKLWTFEDGKLIEGIAVVLLPNNWWAVRIRIQGEIRYLPLSRENRPKIESGRETGRIHIAELGYLVPEQEMWRQEMPHYYWYLLGDGGDKTEHLVAFPWFPDSKFLWDRRGVAASRVLEEPERFQLLNPNAAVLQITVYNPLLIVGLEDSVKVFPYGPDDRDRAWVLSNSHHGVLDVVPLKKWGDDDPERSGHCVA